jgi:SH3-like domain-containing protein
MKRALVLLIAAATATGAAAQTSSGTAVRVTADRVNLRARPSLETEVVGQVMTGDVLTGYERAEGWLAVRPPAHVDFWVFGALVTDGTVQASRVNVRCGPGVSYHTAALLDPGDTVTVREAWGEWLRIAPPDGAGLWTTPYLVPPRPAPAPPLAPPPAAGAAAPAHRTAAAAPLPPVRSEAAPRVVRPARAAAPPDLVRRGLLPVLGQGSRVAREGTVQTVDYVLLRPSRYRLVAADARRRPTTVCYLKGNDEQLDTLLGRRVAAQGPEYWVQGVRHPVMVPDTITPLP